VALNITLNRQSAINCKTPVHKGDCRKDTPTTQVPARNHAHRTTAHRPPPTKAGGSCCVIYLEQATIKFVKVKSFPATTLSASTFCLHVAVIHSLHLLSIPLKIPLHSAWPIPLSHIAAARPTRDPKGGGGGGGSLGRGGQGVTWKCCCGRRKLYFYDTKQTINSSG